MLSGSLWNLTFVWEMAFVRLFNIQYKRKKIQLTSLIKLHSLILIYLFSHAFIENIYKYIFIIIIYFFITSIYFSFLR